MVALIVALFFTPYWAVAQCWTVGCRAFGPSTPAAITLDGSNHCSNSGGATSLSCTLPSVTAGDLITVEATDQDFVITGVADGTNGAYTQIVYSDDATDPGANGIWYFQNSASGSLTVTVNVSTGTNISISAQAWKGVLTSGALDTIFSPYHQVQTGSAANANCGTAVTPSVAGELVIGFMMPDHTTPTAGTNYTLIDTIAGQAYPEYWIQTTATSTNTPFVNGADDWIVSCAGFKP